MRRIWVVAGSWDQEAAGREVLGFGVGPEQPGEDGSFRVRKIDAPRRHGDVRDLAVTAVQAARRPCHRSLWYTLAHANGQNPGVGELAAIHGKHPLARRRAPSPRG